MAKSQSYVCIFFFFQLSEPESQSWQKVNISLVGIFFFYIQSSVPESKPWQKINISNEGIFHLD